MAAGRRGANNGGVTTAATDLVIEIWSDIACPWCYLGTHRLRQATGQLPQAGSLVIRTRSFELDASAPRAATSTLDHLAHKFGLSRAEAERMDERMVELAGADGLPYVVDRPHANSFDAHRLVQLARTEGVGEQLFDALQLALFGHGVDVYDHARLAGIAADVGLAGERVAQVLAGDEFGADVRADEAAAQQLGVTGVPFAVVGGRYAIPGATTVDNYRSVIDRAWSER